MKLILIKFLFGYFYKNFYEFFELIEDVFKIYFEEDFILDIEFLSLLVSWNELFGWI